eukprot:CAMPEP_0182923416 /NCGR_PEP_ID=MMETSP0105_2-20130417/5413_1 /TAXON_ID=81532 ORGANISM="Acanthoeca-like sp., Strain 10tr" /NCGR_SAMPLE_ID=MMETSP0105_2 /ASSEMBLY_ACC=CAM_ASM_000205 /LENGTH=66 /DNA_ID=CAMNT_0025061127 /DNA_START=30 /DNA_END=230 /DNA_ORIENTATION=+
MTWAAVVLMGVMWPVATSEASGAPATETAYLQRGLLTLEVGHGDTIVLGPAPLAPEGMGNLPTRMR